MKEQFTARMLRIHFGEDDRCQGKPLHDAILAKCKELGIAEAIVFRGIEGYGPGSRIRRSGHWTFSKDAPIQLSIIDTDEQVARLIPFLDAAVHPGGGRSILLRRSYPLLPHPAVRRLQAIANTAVLC